MSEAKRLLSSELPLDAVQGKIREITRHSLAGTPVGEVLDDVLGNPGKMLRPMFLLLCGSLGPAYEARLDRLCMLAAMVELTHLASLVHDDIADNAQFRRGKPSIQGKYGKCAAIYAGDLLISRINLWLAKEGMDEAAQLVSTAIENMCLGEIGQERCKYRPDVTREEYLVNIGGKTASLFQTACLLGAREAACSDKVCETLSALGREIGILFQLRDDLLDFDSTEEQEGKELHKDFRDGIYTLPVIHTMGLAEGREVLLPLMERSRCETPSEAELMRMEETVRACGGITAAHQEIRRRADACLALLDSLPDSGATDDMREMLYGLCQV